MMKFYSFRVVTVLLLTQISSGSVIMGQDYFYSLGHRDALKNDANVPIYPWFPDGHISVLAEPESKKHIMYWSEFDNYRSFGEFPFPEFQDTLSPSKSVFGGRKNFESWDNGGSWLMSVFRQKRDTLVGFYHAEDHWVRATNPEGIAWKSIARTISHDNGRNWTVGTQIITSPKAKPQTPTWGGAGDNCVIWDHKNNRWICYYQEHWLMMAVSSDPEGKPGTWFKYNSGEFNQPGLGGESTAIPGLKSIPGGNPSVHYNSYLERFVMVWHSWVTTSIYISTSIDGIIWEEPKLLEPKLGSRRAWYPTIIGESDTKAGKIARLYYADIAAGFTSRDFVSKAIVFDKEIKYQPQTAWQHQLIGKVPILGLMDITNDQKLRIVTFSGSIDKTENIGYHYKHTEGTYLVSGKFQLDELYNKGSVGLSVRSGLSVSDAMAAIILSPDSISFYSRERAGDIQLTKGNSLQWTSNNVWLQIEKSSTTLTCRYSSDGVAWTVFGSIPFGYIPSKIGLFSTGSPDFGTVAYVENVEIKELTTSTETTLEDDCISGFSNPSENQIFIANPECYSHFSIYDVTGKLQLSGVIDSHRVDVQTLRPGLYVLSLHGPKNKKPLLLKLIIAR